MTNKIEKPILSKKKYYEIIEDKCVHCLNNISYRASYRTEEIKKKDKKGKIKINLKKHYLTDLIRFCPYCKELESCEACGIIFCELEKHKGRVSQENPKRCEDCVHFESNIKNYCRVCERDFVESQTESKRRYLTNGNFCLDCIKESIEEGNKIRAEEAIKRAFEKQMKGEKTEQVIELEEEFV